MKNPQNDPSSATKASREDLVRWIAWLAAIRRSLDAMHATKLLYNLGDGHCLMTARAELDKVYDELAELIESGLIPNADINCGTGTAQPKQS